MKRVFNILLLAFAGIGLCSTGYWSFKHLIGDDGLPEKYHFLENLRHIGDGTTLQAEILDLKSELLNKTPQELGLLPINDSAGSSFALPHALIPRSLPFAYHQTNDHGPDNPTAMAINRVVYGTDGKPARLEFILSRQSVVVPLSDDALRPPFTSALKISDSPRIYVCYHGS